MDSQLDVDYALLLDAAPDAICVADAAGRIVLVNAQATALFGYTRDELLRLRVEALLPARLRARHEQHRARYAASPSVRPMGTAGVPLVGLRRDGSEVPVEVSLSAHESARGPLVIAVVRDITAQREGERQLRRARDAAEEANRELEALGYALAHNLRAPFRSIDGLSAGLLDELGPDPGSPLRRDLEALRRSAQRMAALLDATLELTRIVRAPMRWEEVDVAALAREVAAELRRAAPARPVSLTVADPLLARGHPELLRQLLAALLSNAWRFTREVGDARVEVGRETGEVLFVRDNGVGFDPAHAARLFEPFQRAHHPSRSEGLGTGLAAAQRIVHKHGGRIWADARPEGGAIFRFTLAPEEAAR